MVADADLQVWLDMQASTRQTVIVPYVQSARNMRVSYRMNVIQRSDAGTSRTSQEGQVSANASTPTPLARVTLGRQQNGDCRVEVTLREGQNDVGTYHFGCEAQ